jgi:SAM-dependent methyltransferase
VSDAVERHYARADLLEAIRAALLRLGKDPALLTPADLAGFDEFHIRGRAATKELADALGLQPETGILDIGSGLGGPARHLAGTYRCRVTGIDLSADFCRVAAELTSWVGLSDRVAFRHGSALALPFDEGRFDLVWTQHTAMNIADKQTLYAEASRVLKPRGRLALYDVLQGEGGPIHLPVPWARETAISHLATPEALRRLLAGAGFEIVTWRDTTEPARAAFAAAAQQLRSSAPPPPGLALLLGDAYPAVIEAMRRNLDEGRIMVVEAVCRRKG